MRARIAEVGGAFGVAEAKPHGGPEKRQERELINAAANHELHPELRIVAAAHNEACHHLRDHAGNHQRAKENAPVQVPATQPLSQSELALNRRGQAVGCRHKHRITSPGPGLTQAVNPTALARALEWVSKISLDPVHSPSERSSIADHAITSECDLPTG